MILALSVHFDSLFFFRCFIDLFFSPTRMFDMAATKRNAGIIERVRKSEVHVPWCEEFEKMICGMKYDHGMMLYSAKRLLIYFPSFKAGNSQLMLDYKLTIRRRLKLFNDDSMPEGCTLESLKNRRMAVARQILGKAGAGVNIEQPLFCTWGCNIFIGDSCYINRKFVGLRSESAAASNAYFVLAFPFTTVPQSRSAIECSLALAPLSARTPMR